MEKSLKQGLLKQRQAKPGEPGKPGKVFELVKKMKRENQDVIRSRCVRDDTTKTSYK